MGKSGTDSTKLNIHGEVFTLRKDFPRPDRKLVAAFSKIPAANLSDAAGNLNTMDSGIQAMWPGARICGPACTVATRGGDFLATVGGDFAIGYRAHDTEAVHLFCVETIAAQLLTPEAVCLIRPS